MTSATLLPLAIKPDERVCFVGKTGSGKTFLAKHLIAQHPRVLVIDPKGTFNAEGFERWNKKTRKLLRTDEPFRIRIPAVIADKPEAAYDEIFQEVYESDGDILVYIDELYGVTTGTTGGKYLRALYTRGRELGLSIWSATQRPASVPRYTVGECEWIFCFRLQILDDRIRMSETMGKIVRDGIPHDNPHGFFIYHSTWEHPRYCPELTVRK